MAKKKKKHSIARKKAGAERVQIGALPMMRDDDGQLQILLVTSRESGKWVIPKGWPMRGYKKWQAAAIEAEEEAGAIGPIRRSPVGSYRYWKRLEDRFELCRVTVFPLLVTRRLADWKEREMRRWRWLGPLDAADAALEPELSTLILRAVQDKKTLAFVENGGNGKRSG